MGWNKVRLFLLVVTASWLVTYIKSDTRYKNSREFFSLPDGKGQVCFDTVSDGEDWLIIQRRVRGDVTFNRNWADYTAGFGRFDSDFWLGLENVYQVCQNNCLFRVDISYGGNRYFVKYGNFSLSDEADNFRLSLGDCVDGNMTAEEVWQSREGKEAANDQQFSAIDSDNDDGHYGGWWRKDRSCFYNLNGKWLHGNLEGIVWFKRESNVSGLNNGNTYFITFSEMKVKVASDVDWCSLNTSVIALTERQNGTFNFQCNDSRLSYDNVETTAYDNAQYNKKKKKDGPCIDRNQPGWRGTYCHEDDSHDDPCGIHTCQECGDDFSCSCLHGYENLNPKVCVDIDECDRDGVCGNHTCRNKEGSYDCICSNGSYENIGHQICVKPITFEPGKDIEYFFPTEIEVLVIYTFLSTNIIAFAAIVVVSCALTVFNAVGRFVTTEPCNCKQQIYFAQVDSDQYGKKEHVMIIAEHKSEDTISGDGIERDQISLKSIDTISDNHIDRDQISIKIEDNISVNEIERVKSTLV